MSKQNYERYFRKLVDVNEGYLGKILNSCFSVTQEYADLKAVIGDTARGHAYLARFLNGKGMLEEATNEYMIAINLEPFNPIRHAEFANALSIRGDLKNAITWWQKQKMLSPQDEKIYLSLSYAFMRLNQFDEALRELHDLVSLYPENMDYHIKLIRTLMAVGRVDEAIEKYYEVMERNQNFPKLPDNRIRDYQRKGDYTKATKTLDEVLTSALNK
jgi:tetratricopeptide (TPR) repeat protein